MYSVCLSYTLLMSSLLLYLNDGQFGGFTCMCAKSYQSKHLVVACDIIEFLCF
jgi:hypothetical protein